MTIRVRYCIIIGRGDCYGVKQGIFGFRFRTTSGAEEKEVNNIETRLSGYSDMDSCSIFLQIFSNQFQLIPNSRCKDKKLAQILVIKIKRYQMICRSRIL